MKKTFLMLSASSLLFTACGNNSAEGRHEHNTETTTAAPTEATAAEESHEGHSTTVSLDNGKKWKANPETVEGIANMQSIVAKGKAENTAPESLHAALSTEFKTIFEKCTMKGAAHDQLHNYLMPIKADLDKLKDNNSAQDGLSSLEAHLKTFDNYFEL